MLPQPSLSGTGQILVGILVLAAAVYDIRFRRIPNRLVLAGLVAGFAWNVYSAGWSGLGAASAGLGTGFALYFPLYLLRARGAGDVKLLGAVGAITGPGGCLWIFLLTALLGGVMAVVLVLFRGRARETFFNVAWIMRELLQFRSPWRSSPQLDVTTTAGMRLPHALTMAAGVAAFVLMVRWRV